MERQYMIEDAFPDDVTELLISNETDEVDEIDEEEDSEAEEEDEEEEIDEDQDNVFFLNRNSLSYI